MKKQLVYLVIVYVLFFCSIRAFAQAPNITYSTLTNVYTKNVAITALVPTNSGGAVPANIYGQVTTLVTTAAGLNNPQALAADNSGNVYVADYGNNKIRKITSAGVMTTLAGSGTAGEVDNPTGTSAQFNGPDGIAFDGAANLYVADAGGNKIRKIVIATGAVTTYAGSGTAGSTNGTTLLNSTFNGPAGLSLDAAGNMYICDQGNNLIRMITSGGVVSTLAGSGAAGAVNGTGTAASFNQPNDLEVDGAGNVYVADYGNSLVRKIVVSTKAVTTFAGSSAGYTDATGTSAQFNRLASLTIDVAGNVVVGDLSNNRIRSATAPGAVVTTVAGSGAGAETDGTGALAAFSSPGGIDVDNSDNCYVLDYQGGTTGTVRKLVLTGYAISPTALPAGLTFNATTGTISGTPTVTSAATNYTITAYNTSGSSSVTISIACGQTVAWTAGSNSTAWATGGNWSTGAQPTANDAVSIGVSAYTNAKEPAITAAGVTVNSLTFGSVHNGTLTITGQTLTVNSGFTVNTGATPTVTGTGSINIGPTAVLSINGTGVLTTTLTGKLTLKSTSAGSASVGQLAGSTSIAGSGASSIYVERYFTGGSNAYRGYRLLSSPVYNGTVSGNHIYNLDYIIASALVTGVTGAAGGFDKTGNPTIYLFREDQAVSNATFTGGNFWGVSKLNNAPTYNLYMNGGATTYNLPAGNGVNFFFRGDRTTNLALKYTTTTSAESVTFTTSGTLNIGQVIVKDWYTPASSNLGFTATAGNGTVQGYNLVGNPYASSIDWENLQSATTTTGIYGVNIGTTIYTLNPLSHNYGSYTKGGGGVGTNNATNIISSGQGFFVVAGNSSAQLIFNETAKSTTQSTGVNLFLGRPVDYANNQYLRLQLAKDSINTDDILLRFSSNVTTAYSPVVDAPYKPGFGVVSLSSMSSDQVRLAINVQPLPKTSEAIALNVNTNTDGTYSLNLKDLVGIPKLFDIWLLDEFKKDSVNLRLNPNYSFTVSKSDTNTFGSHRFKLIIGQDPAYAYRLLDFTATKESVPTQVQVVWKAQNEANYTNFTLERSTDNGKTFTVIGGMVSSDLGTYSLVDKSPVMGQNLYRLKQEDINDSISYSNIIPIQYSNLSNNLVKSNISVYPNPASSTISLAIGTNVNTTGTFNIKITNSSGLVIKQAMSNQPSWQTNVNDLLPGTYIVNVLNTKDNSLVGNTKFVKE